MARQRILELNARLQEAANAYYKRNEPLMSDAEFDKLEHELQQLVEKHPELAGEATYLTVVGSDFDFTKGNGRVYHNTPMLSIENTYTEAELLEWYNGLPAGTVVCLEPKFDGISVSLHYRNGELVRALTRGDGKSGEDITLQVLAVRSIPQQLRPNLPENLEIRGELVMENFTLDRINREAEAKGTKTYSSTRNLTGGTMKLKDLSLIPDREIQLRPWLVSGSDLPDSSLERLQLIADSGFAQPLGVLVKGNSPEAVLAVLRQALIERDTKLRKMMSLETDGVVMKVDSEALRQKLGVSSKYTNYQVCFKPQSASGTTYLRSIEWQTGRTGKVTPVAVCDPVVLAGAKVEHAGLNNITWIREKGLKLGAKVEMLRSGDVIPQIVRVLDEGESEIIPPSNCPECLTLLIESDEGGAGTLTHRCPNSACSGRVRDTLTFIASRDVLEIDGLGPEMARKLVTDGLVNGLATLYEFQAAMKPLLDEDEGKFIEVMRLKGFDATLPKMIRSLEATKTASWERWIKALTIPMIGATLGRTIALTMDLRPEDMTGVRLRGKFLQFTQQKVDGFGEAKLKAIEDWVLCNESFVLCESLGKQGIRPTAVPRPKVVAGAPLAGVNFCITGEFDEDREAITAKLVSLGAASKSGVSSKVNLLIVGSAAGKSKTKKATELGIKTVGVEWLSQTLAENGLQLES